MTPVSLLTLIRVLLDLVWVPQFDEHYRNACGIACLRMIGLYYGIELPTIHDMADQTALAQKDDGLMPLQVVDEAEKIGLKAHYLDDVSIDAIKQELVAGHPVIALILYGEIAERENKADVTGDHYVVITGWDAQHFYVNDPDMHEEHLGKNMPIPVAEFERAWAHSGIEDCIIFVSPPDGWQPKAPLDLITAPIEPAKPPEPPAEPAPTTELAPELPVVAAIQPGAAHVSATDGLHLRTNASKNSPALASLPSGTPVTVLPGAPVKADGYIWLPVSVHGVIGWCAQDFLTAGVSASIVITVPPPISLSHKLIGIGMMGSHVDIAYIKSTQYGVYKAVDTPEYLQAAYEANRYATHIFRHYRDEKNPAVSDAVLYVNQHGGVDSAVTALMAEMEPYFNAVPFAHFESGFNEQNPSPEFLALEEAWVIALAKRNLKACALNTSVGATQSGTPQSIWPRAYSLVQACINTGSIIGVHCYWQTVASANYGDSLWDKDGNWHGELYPAYSRSARGWTGFRIFEDAYELQALGLGAAHLVASELGPDKVAQGATNGIYGPKQGVTGGWKSCTGVWHDLKWPEQYQQNDAQFCRAQFDWWGSMVRNVPQIIGGAGYTEGSDDPKWADYDLTGVL